MVGAGRTVEVCPSPVTPTTMKRHELREIISHGESSTVEFKRKFTTVDKIAREIIAFANTTGGMLIIGVDDNGTIVGVESEKEQIAQVEACTLVITPELQLATEVVEIEFRDVVVIHVPNSQNKPHRLVSDDPDERPHQRKAYIRQGEKSVTASREMTRILASQNPTSPPMTLSIGDRERRLFTYLERHGRASVTDFARLVNISKRRAAQILVKLVRAGVVHINSDAGGDFYTLV